LDAVISSKAKLPSASEEGFLRKVSEERWKELAHLGFFPNRTTSIDIHQAADKAIMLVPLLKNKILVHDIFSHWFQALHDLCTKDITWWGVTDAVLESVDQLIRIYDDVDLKKMYIFHLANFEYLKGECAYEADVREKHVKNRIALLEQLAELDD
jgi:hypothetical protein